MSGSGQSLFSILKERWATLSKGSLISNQNELSEPSKKAPCASHDTYLGSCTYSTYLSRIIKDQIMHALLFLFYFVCFLGERPVWITVHSLPLADWILLGGGGHKDTQCLNDVLGHIDARISKQHRFDSGTFVGEIDTKPTHWRCKVQGYYAICWIGLGT